MKHGSLAALCALVLLPGLARAQDVAVTLKAGTFGIGGGVVAAVSPQFNLRVDVPYFAYSHESTRQVEDFDLAYEADAKLFSIGAIVDYHPFRNLLRLSAGALYNGNEATFVGRSAEPYTVGSVTYSPEQIGELSGTVRQSATIAPYLGIGLGNPVALGKRIGFTLDLGVMFGGEPEVTMEGTGMIAPTAEEAGTIEENLGWATMYPGLMLGLSYKVH